MYICDDYIVDNVDVLKPVKELIKGSVYDKLLLLWGSDKLHDYKKIAKSAEETPTSADYIVTPFANALYELRDQKKSLLSDDLYGIYAGLVPEAQNDTCRLPVYFIFRCSNNGRSLIISEKEIPDCTTE